MGVKLKRSAVAGKAPAVADLELGELAMNTHDGKLYLKKSVAGVESIVELAGTISSSVNTVRQTYSGDGIATAFTLPLSPSPGALVQVFLSGVSQQASRYSVSGSTITFTTAPPAGTGNIEVVIVSISGVTNAVGDNSVGTANIQNGAVTLEKLGSGIGNVVSRNVGTGPNNIPALNADGRLPAVDGSLLTGVAGVPPGAVMPYAGASEPSGWLFCFGQNVSRTTYAALFAVLGTTYGAGDGSTTFGLPDLRGRVIAGQDDMGGTSANRLTGQSGGLDGDVLGATGGAETHTLTTAQMPSHNHTFTGATPVYGISGTGGMFGNQLGGINTNVGSVGIANNGGGGAHNNVQPTIVLNYIIKT